MRILWLATGLLFLGVGLLGIVLPVLPTTPFLLISAACFANSSPKLHNWLLGHPVFGPPIRNWEENGAISRGAKRLAVGTMATVFGLSVVFSLPWQALVAQGLLMGVGAAFILSRPDGRSG
jgi:uncharacterized protein